MRFDPLLRNWRRAAYSKFPPASAYPKENSAPGLVLDCVCFADGEVDILSASIEPTDYEAGLMDMDEDVHKPYSPPEFQDLDERLQDALRATLEAYGVGDDTVAFLRDFVQLKEQTEYANYLKTIKDFTTNAEH